MLFTVAYLRQGGGVVAKVVDQRDAEGEWLLAGRHLDVGARQLQEDEHLVLEADEAGLAERDDVGRRGRHRHAQPRRPPVVAAASHA